MIHPIFLDASTTFFDQNIIDLIKGIGDELGNGQGLFLNEAKEIAAILSLLYLAGKAYAMILGEGRLEIMPLFRPFIITLVIVNFGLVGDILGSVGNAAQNTAETAFKANATGMDNMLAVKQQEMDSVEQIVQTTSGSIQQQIATYQSATMAGTPNFISEPISQMDAWLTVNTNLLWTRASMWLQGIIMWVALAVMKGVMYCIFFLQLIVLHILLIIGPIAFAFSILSAFGNSWVEWVKHFVSVSFWGTIAFIVMNIVCAIVMYGLQQETSRLSWILSQAHDLINVPPGSVANPTQAAATFFASVNHIDNFLGFLLIGLITAIGGIASTPLIANWIIGGATQNAMRGMGMAGSMVAAPIAGAVSSGAATVIGAGGEAVSSTMRNSTSGSSPIIPPPQQPRP